MKESGAIQMVLDTVAMMPLISADELAAVCGIGWRRCYRLVSRAREDGVIESVSYRVAGAAVERWRLTGTGVGVLAERKGITVKEALRDWPLSAQWERSLLRRIHTVALCYRIAVEALRIEPGMPVWRWERSDVYDAFMTLASGRTFGICRMGPSISVKSISSRIRSLSVLNYYGYVDSALVITPGPIEQNNLVRRLERTYMNLAIGTEEKVLQGGPGEPAWRTPLYRPLDDFPLDGFIEAASIQEIPPRRQPPKLASMPKGNEVLGSDSTELIAATLADSGTLILNTVANWPLIDNRKALQITGMGSEWFRKERTRLINIGALAQVRMPNNTNRSKSLRLVLTDYGLRLVAWRDRTTLSDLTRAWSICPDENGEAKDPIAGHVIKGTKLRVAARELSHTDSLQELACSIQTSCAGTAEWHVEQLLPTHRWERWFYYNNRRYGIRPDATALLRYNDNQVALLIEYEQRAMTPAGMLEKVTRYTRYFGSPETGLDFASPPVAVMVFPDSASASRFIVHLARSMRRARDGRARRFRMLASSLEDIHRRGFAGAAWWDPMHHGEGQLTLADCMIRMFGCVAG